MSETIIDPRITSAMIAIHRAIHDRDRKTIEVAPGWTLPITGYNLRTVTFERRQFVEQNPNKRSSYAQRAKAGEHITWGIPVSGDAESWIYIDDKIADAFEARVKAETTGTK